MKKVVVILTILLSPVAWGIEPSFYILQAEQAKKNKKYTIAIKLFGNALNFVKDSKLKTKILFQMGDCYYEINNEIAAFDLYSEALKSPYSKEYLISHPKTYLNLANIYFDRAEYRKAVEIYLNIAQRYKTKPFAAFSLVKAGDGLVSIKEYKKALEAYSKVILLYENTAEYWISKFRMADIGISHPNIDVPDQIEYRSYFKPLLAYKDIIENAPQELIKLKQLARLRIASAYLKAKKYQECISIIDSFLKDFPFSTFEEYAKRLLNSAFKEYVVELYKKGDFKSICKLYDSLKKELPSKLEQEILTMVADAKFNIGLYKDALKLYMLNPKAHIKQIATVYNLLGRYTDTISLLMPIKSKLDHDLVILLAEALYKRKRFNDIISLLNKGNITDPEAHYILARSYDELGDTKEAIQHYLVLIKKDSEYQLSACLYLANLFFKQGKYKKALYYYNISKKLCKGCPDSDFITIQIANCYYYLGDYKKSASLFKTVKGSNLLKEYSKIEAEIIELENRYEELKWLIE